MSGPDCLLAEELRALHDGRLDRDVEERANAHLEECPACRELYYELPERPASTSAERAPSEAEITAFAERVKARAAKFFTTDREPSATVVPFTKPSWSGVRLAAHVKAASRLLVSPPDGVRVLETDDLEVRVVEFQGDVQRATDETLVLVEATLTPTTSHAFSSATDVAVTDADGNPLDPLDVFVRPLVWTGTFTGGGTFVIRVPSKEVVVRVDVQRPR